jgi:hypothetical protein
VMRAALVIEVLIAYPPCGNLCRSCLVSYVGRFFSVLFPLSVLLLLSKSVVGGDESTMDLWL